ncbi:MAG: hypothetical protein HY301_07935 [Verrucomicrobia bacterium]|nr:hypothetical protein [Verrucomicrobiota bacterium]
MSNVGNFPKALRGILFGLGVLLAVCSLRAAPPLQFLSRGVGAGGGMFAPIINPYNAAEIYLACDMSPLFHTTNGAAAWETLDWRSIQAFHMTAVQFTSDPLVRYALDYSHTVGTGFDSEKPAKSTDGGATWHQLPTNAWPFGTAYTVLADPLVTNRLIVSSYTNVYFSTDGGSNFTSLSSTPSNRVAGAFFDGANIFIAVRDGLLVSQNGGTNFTFTNFPGFANTQLMYSFAGARQGGVTRFFCVAVPPTSVFPDSGVNFGTNKAAYTMDWGQTNWTPVMNGFHTNDRLGFVAMATNDINTAYVACARPFGAFPYPQNISVYKTANAGASWANTLLISNNANIFTGWGGQPGVTTVDYGNMPLGFTVNPNDANHAIVTDSGLIHMTTNGGASWRQVYVSTADQNPTNALIQQSKSYHGVGLEPTASWWLAWLDATNLFAGFSDIRAIRSVDGGAKWSYDYTGFNSSNDECHQVVPHPTVSNLWYAIESSLLTHGQLFGVLDSDTDGKTGDVKFSVDHGKTWQLLTNFGAPPVWMTIDTNNTGTMYVSTFNSTNGGVWVTSNLLAGAAATWTKLPPPLTPTNRTEGRPYNIRVLNDGTLIVTYSAHQVTNGGTHFSQSSGVFVSTNGGANWTDRSASGKQMHYWTQDLIVDPHDTTQSNWYVCVWDAFGVGNPNPSLQHGLYKTTDRGQSWTLLSTFGNESVTSCTISPTNPNEMYVTTRFNGLWYCNNLRSGTPTFAPVASYPFRSPTRVFYNPYNANEIWITSDGNGLRVGTVTPLAAWRALKFAGNETNAAIAGDFADPDGDGVPNLLEYLLGTDPNAAASAGRPGLGSANESGSNFLTLTFSFDTNQTDVTATVLVSPDVTNWFAGSVYSASNSVPNTAFTTQVSRSGGNPQTIVVRDNVPVESAVRQFMKLQVTSP